MRRELSEPTDPLSLPTSSIPRRTWLGFGEAKTFPQTAASYRNKTESADGMQRETLRTGQDAIAYETGMGGLMA